MIKNAKRLACLPQAGAMRIASKGIDVEGELAIIMANSPFLIFFTTDLPSIVKT